MPFGCVFNKLGLKLDGTHKSGVH